MNKLRTASAVVGAVAAVAIGGAAFAAGGDDPSPSPSVSDDRGGTVDMLPDGTVVPSASASTDDNPSPSDLGSSSPTASPSASASTSAPAPAPSASSAQGISMNQAKTIALRAAGGGYVESIERETEHGRAVWDVDVIRSGVEHDIDVDRSTGAITRHRTEKDDDKSNGNSSSDDKSSKSDDKSGSSDDKGGNSGHGSGADDDHDSDDDNGGHGHGSDD